MRPPHHRIKPHLTIIDLDDFDTERVNTEIDGLEPHHASEHPVIQYRQGETHFDLDAPGCVYGDEGPEQRTAREYLNDDPRVFTARRLSLAELAVCLDWGDHVSATRAFAQAVKQIGGFPYEVKAKKALSEAQLARVTDEIGADAVFRVGKMVIAASRAPTRAEGKRSGSSPGRTSPDPGVSPADGDPGTASDAA